MRSSQARIAALLAFAAAALLLIPAAASAATVFGSRLNHDPANANECMELGPCTIASYIVPTDPNGDPYAGGAPASGVITSFRIRAKAPNPTQVTFKLAEVNPVAGTSGDTAIGKAVATGPTVTIAPTSEEAESVPIQQFAARVPVKAGQHLALDTGPGIETTYNSSGDKFSYVFAPPLGGTPQASLTATGELLVQATIEPDADNDGFGDETQDQCPSQPGTHGPCVAPPPPPAAAPVAVSGLGVAGGKLSYTLSAAATVHLALAKRTVGRKAGAKCVKVTKANRKKAHCVTYKPLGSGFAGPGAVGADTVGIPGAARLGAGRYRVILTATDATGGTATVTTYFKVKPKPKKKRH